MAFVSLFSGVRISPHLNSQYCHRNHVPATVRANMGDSIAPKITINDNKNETSSVNIDWQTVNPPLSLAVSVTGNSALAATLAGRKDTSTKFLSSKSTQSVPSGISPADFYYPPAKRNVAPVVNLSNPFSSNARIDVAFDVISHTVSGVSSNAPDSVAFWKRSSTKQYSAPNTFQYKAQGSEPISTEMFEKYIPSSRRNKAPLIQLKKPAFEGDESAYCFVETEYVSLNHALAEELSMAFGQDESTTPKE